MNTVRFPADRLVSLLQDNKISTMPELKVALGTSVTYTVLRKLSALGYLSMNNLFELSPLSNICLI